MNKKRCPSANYTATPYLPPFSLQFPKQPNQAPTKQGNTRTTALLAIAKQNNLDIALITTNPHQGVPAAYLALNPLGKIPTFVGTDGLVLSEVLAIAVYRKRRPAQHPPRPHKADHAVASQDTHGALLGASKRERADVLRWMSFANSEVLPPLGGWFAPLVGRAPYVEARVAAARAQTLRAVDVLEEHLLARTYVVGDRVTVADLFVASVVARALQYCLDGEWRGGHGNVMRWFETVRNVPCYAAVAGDFVFRDDTSQSGAVVNSAEEE